MAIPDAPDPHGTLAWINAIFETVKQAYVALLIPTAAGIAWVVKTSTSRRDQAQKRADDLRQSEEDKHRRAEEQLDKDSADYVAGLRAESQRLRAENVDLQAEIKRLQIEISRLIGLIRRWYDLAHSTRHEGIRILQHLYSFMYQAGRDPPDLRMPDLSYDPDAP